MFKKLKYKKIDNQPKSQLKITIKIYGNNMFEKKRVNL